MISETTKKQIVEAMKAKDEIRLSTLKLLSAALQNAEIAKRAKVGADPKAYKLTKEEELGVVKKEAKKRRDAIEAYEKAGAKDRAEKEKKELIILQEFLPEEMSEEELKKIVEEVVVETGAIGAKDFGKVMGQVMSKTKRRADGKMVAELVKQHLTS